MKISLYTSRLLKKQKDTMRLTFMIVSGRPWSMWMLFLRDPAPGDTL